MPRCTTLFLMMFCHISLFSQGVAKMQSFTIAAPDTVMQGEEFVAVYTLKSNGWDSSSFPRMSNGFATRKVKFNTVKGIPYSQSIATVRLVTSRSGEMTLPVWQVPVGGKMVTPQTRKIFVKQHSKYGEEMNVAHQWLVQKGQSSDSICLKMEYEDTGFYLFSDPVYKLFCLIAKKSVWPFLEQPVLAYSLESPMVGPSKDFPLYNALFSSYTEQIKVLLSQNVSQNARAKSLKNEKVEPLMGDLRWGPDKPYNSTAPALSGKHLQIGCLPLATAMIMKYHNWPDVDEAGWTPRWVSFKDHYSEDEKGEADSLSARLTFLSQVMAEDIKQIVTSASLYRVKPVLCNHMKFSSKMDVLFEMESDTLIPKIVFKELDAHRPCLASVIGHVFVCDGYDGDFIHYNMGLDGLCNGYYRLRLADYEPQVGKSLVMVKAIVYGIEPRLNDIRKEITLSKAGTLANVLTDKEKSSITELAIFGPVNSSDIKLIRWMAGAKDDKGFLGEKGGALRHLDLSKVVLVADKNPYLETIAFGEWTKTEVTTFQGLSFEKNRETYKVGTMSDEEWKKFVNNIGTKHDGFWYSRKEDNSCWENCFVRKNIIGRKMFMNCSSLSSIILPNNIKEIDNLAFWGCTSLEQIRIPKKVKKMGIVPFQDCLSLEKIEMPRGVELDGPIADNCSPALERPDYYQVEK